MQSTRPHVRDTNSITEFTVEWLVILVRFWESPASKHGREQIPLLRPFLAFLSLSKQILALYIELAILHLSLVTTTWRVLRLWMEGKLQIWNVAVNVLNKQSWTADKMWSSSLEVGRGANNSSR
jgi:hypothetical protein